MELACLSLEELGFSETVYEHLPQQQTGQQQQHRGKGRQQQQQAGDADRDARSVYVSNLTSNTSRDQLSELFSCCGAIRCITIPRSQQQLAHAYIEFATADEAAAAVKLHRQVSVKGRLVSVNPKRTNIRGYDVFQGHMGQVGRRGRRGNMLAGAGGPQGGGAAGGGPPIVSFERQAAVFPSWGPPPVHHPHYYQLPPQRHYHQQQPQQQRHYHHQQQQPQQHGGNSNGDGARR